MRNNSQTNPNKGIEGRLEAIIVLLSELLPQNNPASEKAREKAVTKLVDGGVSTTQTAKLLSMRRERV
jgi:hypothetical protein